MVSVVVVLYKRIAATWNVVTDLIANAVDKVPVPVGDVETSFGVKKSRPSKEALLQVPMRSMPSGY